MTPGNGKRRPVRRGGVPNDQAADVINHSVPPGTDIVAAVAVALVELLDADPGPDWRRVPLGQFVLSDGAAREYVVQVTARPAELRTVAS